MDLGSINDPTAVEIAVAAALLSASKGEINTHTHFTDNIFRVGLNYQFHWSDYGFRKSSGSLAIFTAIRRASSRVSNFAADLRPGSSSK
jgi:hypothetical protein